jgi:hypothetical protein
MEDVDQDLAPWLEASIGGDIVSRYKLPTETELHAVHAQLSRGCRESKRFTMVEAKGEEDESE